MREADPLNTRLNVSKHSNLDTAPAEQISTSVPRQTSTTEDSDHQIGPFTVTENGENKATRFSSYAIALAVGLLAVVTMLTRSTIVGHGGLWDSPGTDLAQNLTGYFALQHSGWHWPLLFSPDIAWPHGLSVGMTDSNPALSLIGKVAATVTGHPVNLFGLWLVLCWMLQPVAAVYALRGLGGSGVALRWGRSPGAFGWEAAAAAAAMSVMFPALLYRYFHINLLAHFTILVALGCAARMLRLRDAGRWRAAAALLFVTVVLHPYLFVFAAIVLAAPVLQAFSWGRAPGLRATRFYLAATIAPVLLYALLNGTLGGSDSGFGLLSMNLLSPIWPQQSGLFGPALPILDATGGQYEGFNYLGFGGLVLLAAAIATGGLRSIRRWWPLSILLAIVTLVALSPHIYAGQRQLLAAGLWPWNQVFGVIRASGRAFWIVGYTLEIGAIAFLATRLPRLLLVPLLAVAVVLQFIDTTPLRLRAETYYATGEPAGFPLPVLPADATLLRMVPVCALRGTLLAGLPDYERLIAVKAGMQIADVRASRLPRWFNCEMGFSDGLELPLRSHEIRVFVGPAITALRQEALGPDAVCRRQADTVLCGRDLSIAGDPVAAGVALPRLAIGAAGASVAPLLSSGWHLDEKDNAWSEGPSSSLLFRRDAADNVPAQLILHMRGIANKGDAGRPVTVSVNDGPSETVVLPDLTDTTVPLHLPSTPGGVVRVTFALYRPVDPAKRSLSIPVNRAGLLLTAVELVPPSRE